MRRDTHVHRDEPLLGRARAARPISRRSGSAATAISTGCRASSSSTCSRGPSARITCSMPRTRSGAPTPTSRPGPGRRRSARRTGMPAAAAALSGPPAVRGLRGDPDRGRPRRERPGTGRRLATASGLEAALDVPDQLARHSSTGSSSVGDHQIGVLRRLVGAADAGELGDLALARALVEALRVALLAGVERAP